MFNYCIDMIQKGPSKCSFYVIQCIPGVFNVDFVIDDSSLFNNNVVISVQVDLRPESSEDHTIIEEAVHNMLQDLCCSYSYGIVFSDKSLGVSGK